MTEPPATLRFLGPFQLAVDGHELVIGQPRLEELLALLAVQSNQLISRAQLAYQIWPESSEHQARVNLRNLLYKLKQAWPGMGEAIDVTRAHVAWRTDAAIVIDLHRFESLAVEAGQHSDPDGRIAALIEVTDLYHGDFLATCYADWALAERERLRGKYVTMLEQLIDLLVAQRRYDEALSHAKSLQRFDPLHESTYRYLMQVYVALGDRAAALRVYHNCASTLQQELGVEPSPATERVYAQLLRVDEQVPAPNAPQTVPRQHLVGRHDEWLQLQTAWRLAQQGEARCLLVWGEAGIGKTRLAEELIDWVQRQGLTWSSSRCYAVEGALTYAPITEWLRSPAIRPSLDAIDDLWRVELSRLLPELLADRTDLPPPGPMTETWQQQRFFQSIVHALQAAPGPLLLHLDDMQWSDAETLTLLQFLLHGARNHPLLLLGGIRTEDAGGNQPLAAFVEATRHTGQLHELRLGLLSVQETAELATQTSGDNVEMDVAEALYASSEGHPLFLIEAVHSGLAISSQSGDVEPANTSVVAGGFARDVVGDRVDVVAMPPRIYNLLAARLSQLSETAQQVASMAAVIGRAFDYEILQTAVSLDEMTLIDAMDELWRRRVIREQTGDSYDFSHDRIREVAYQGISRARCRLYHRRVAEALETVHRGHLDDVAGELATHYARAGDSSRAFAYYRQAAQLSLDQFALSQAEVLYETALQHAPDDPVARIELLADLCRIYNATLQREKWRASLEQQQSLLDAMDAPSPDLRIKLLLRFSKYWHSSGETENGMAAVNEAFPLAQASGDRTMLARCYEELGLSYWMQARMSEARDAFGQMVRLASEANEAALEATAHELLAQAGMFSGMSSDELREHLLHSFAWAEGAGHKQFMARLLNKLAYLQVSVGMGAFDRIEEAYQRANDLYIDIGNQREQSIALSNLGVALTNRGEYRGAQSALKEATEIEQEEQLYWRNWVTLYHTGAMWMQMGCVDQALATLTTASAELHRFGSHHFEVKARCDLGLLHHLAGDQAQAQSELQQALSLIGGHGDLRFEALANTRLGYILEALGRYCEAQSLYHHGGDLHEQMGQHYYAMNAVAGLARIAALQGEDDVALDHATTIWETIGNQEMDATIETARTLRTSYTIFEANDDPRAGAVLAMAWAQLQRRVSTIDEADHVELFWKIEDHRFFRRIGKDNRV